MADKGNKRHLKALSAPKYFSIEKKESAYVAKQNPGRFKLSTSVPLVIALGKLPGGSARRSDLKSIIKAGDVKVNYKIINDPKYPIGLNDIIELEKEGKSYLIGIDRRAKFAFSELKSKPAGRLQKVVGKFKYAGGKIMVRLYDGTVLGADKGAGVNDSVIIGSDGSVQKAIKMGIGVKCFVYNGVHVGEAGTIKELIPGAANREASAKIEGEGGVLFDTQLKNIMAIE
ncbi:MAG: S4 domain-containing protein [Candidatus Micrarchaeaceae archaeon]